MDVADQLHAGPERPHELEGNAPDPDDSCSDSHDGQFWVRTTLDQALRTMMENSDNQSTNAVQELFGNGSAAWGRYYMNLTAHGDLDMSADSQLAHKLGCDGPSNNPANILRDQIRAGLASHL